MRGFDWTGSGQRALDPLQPGATSTPRPKTPVTAAAEELGIYPGFTLGGQHRGPPAAHLEKHESPRTTRRAKSIRAEVQQPPGQRWRKRRSLDMGGGYHALACGDCAKLE